VSHVGRSSFTVAAEVCDGDQLLASSRAVLVGFDSKTQRAAPLTPDQRERLLGQLETS
jgi:acyl-CoA thioester hydrolase